MSTLQSTRYLIVGGGVTAANAADKIRALDRGGQVTIVGLEPHLPYDRPPLTKDFLQNDGETPGDILSRPAEFYRENDITVHTGARATNIDPHRKIVTSENGETLEYDRLLLATGASPKTLDVPGKDLDGVKILRWVDESEAIRTALKSARQVVLVGGGYIGLEVAASIMKRGEGHKVTIVDPASRPWSKVGSPMLGAFLQHYFTNLGAEFRLGETTAEFIGQGKLRQIRLESGDRLPADLAVVGIGVSLETSLATDAGLEVHPKEGVVVDEYLRTSDGSIWAAGDIACFPDTVMGQRWHLEHYMNAMWQGECVGANMAGTATPYNQAPYFFSDMGDLHMVIRGNVRNPGQTRVLGDPAKNRFVELYPDDSGTVRMIIAVSENQAELESLADRYDPIIRAARPVSEIVESDVGV